MWDTIASLAVIPALLALFAAVLRRSLSRSRGMVVRWAEESGLELKDCRWHRCGAWTVRVVDPDGRTRDAWVRCGNPLIGMRSRRVEVRWTRFTHNVPV
jgi:hypothetical protein